MPLTERVDNQNLTLRSTVLLVTGSSHSILGELIDGKANSIAYSAYGEQSAQQDVAGRLGFNGQLREGGIGWYLLGNGYRAYNPRLMRFHSPDSWSPFRRGGLNPYMYCVGDPVNYSDPTGHSLLGAIKLFVQENVSFGGSAKKLAARNAARRVKGIARQRAMYALGAGGGASAPGNRASTRSGLVDILAYVAGAPGPRGNNAPPIQYVETLQKSPPGHIGPVFTAGPAHNGNYLNGSISGTAGASSNANMQRSMPLWDADTIAASAQPQTISAYPVGTGSPPPVSGPIRQGDTSSSSVRPPSSAQVGGPTHHSAVRPTAAVAAIRRGAPPPPPPRPSSSSSGSFDPSGDSDW